MFVQAKTFIDEQFQSAKDTASEAFATVNNKLQPAKDILTEGVNDAKKRLKDIAEVALDGLATANEKVQPAKDSLHRGVKSVRNKVNDAALFVIGVIDEKYQQVTTSERFLSATDFLGRKINVVTQGAKTALTALHTKLQPVKEAANRTFESLKDHGVRLGNHVKTQGRIGYNNVVTSQRFIQLKNQALVIRDFTVWTKNRFVDRVEGLPEKTTLALLAVPVVNTVVYIIKDNQLRKECPELVELRKMQIKERSLASDVEELRKYLDKHPEEEDTTNRVAAANRGLFKLKGKLLGQLRGQRRALESDLAKRQQGAQLLGDLSVAEAVKQKRERYQRTMIVGIVVLAVAAIALVCLVGVSAIAAAAPVIACIALGISIGAFIAVSQRDQWTYQATKGKTEKAEIEALEALETARRARLQPLPRRRSF